MRLIERLPELRGRYSENVVLAKTTWFRVGGPAQVVYKPADLQDLCDFMQQCPSDVPVTAVGVGSNLLVRDGGVQGVVIRLGRGFNDLSISGNILEVGAATLDSTVASACALEGKTGVEFLCGIPGTIGGALRMNAGCYGRETKDALISLQAVDRTGKIHDVSVADCGFGYRRCGLPEDWVFTSARFKVADALPEQVAETVRQMLGQRESTQPIRSRTGGSTFANPPGYKAWELIDQAGCRGLQVGGAQVSEKHCNFLINTDKATAQDLEALGETVRQRVAETSGVTLHWEIRRLGDDNAVAAPSFKRIAVLKGGWNAEREISLLSGHAMAEAARQLGHDVIEIDVQRDLQWLLQQLTPLPDLVINALHGVWGEDGRIQGILDLLGVPYTASGVLASALAMDKTAARQAFAAAQLPIPGGQEWHIDQLSAAHAPQPYPFVMKPPCEGSSVGVFLIHTPHDYAQALAAWSFGTRVLIEEYIPGGELSTALMGEHALGTTELRPHEGFYDYQNKYTNGMTQHFMPAPIPPQHYEMTLDLAQRAAAALGTTGVCRVDFRYNPADTENPLRILEVNTQPGMTQLSIVPEVAAYQGMGFNDIVAWMIENAQCHA